MNGQSSPWYTERGPQRLRVTVSAGVPAMRLQVWSGAAWVTTGGPWSVDVTTDPTGFLATGSGDGITWPSWSGGASAGNQPSEAQVWSWRLDGAGSSRLTLSLSGTVLGDLRLEGDAVVGSTTSHTNAQVCGGLHGGAAGSAGGMWAGWGRINTGAVYAASTVDNGTLNLVAGTRAGAAVCVGYALGGTLQGASARAVASGSTFLSLSPGTPAGSLASPRLSLALFRGSTGTGSAASATGVVIDLYVPVGTLT